MNEDKVEEGMELSPLCSILTIYAILGGLKSQFLQSSILQHETCPWCCCCAFNSAPLPASILAVCLSREHPKLLPGISFSNCPWDTGFPLRFRYCRCLCHASPSGAPGCSHGWAVSRSWWCCSGLPQQLRPQDRRHRRPCSTSLHLPLWLWRRFDHSPAGVAFLKKKILPVKAPNFSMPTLWA